jgi:hypothetical protein
MFDVYNNRPVIADPGCWREAYPPIVGNYWQDVIHVFGY